MVTSAEIEAGDRAIKLQMDLLRLEMDRPLKTIKIDGIKHREKWPYTKGFRAHMVKQMRKQKAPMNSTYLTRFPGERGNDRLLMP